MLNRKLHPERWSLFFDRLSKELQAGGQKKYAKLRLILPEREGALDMAHWLPLIGITYDPKDHVLYVRLESLTHRINQPWVIWASVDAEKEVNMFLLLCHDGSRVFIELN